MLKNHLKNIAILIVCTFTLSVCFAHANDKNKYHPSMLIYKKPATSWVEALPLGNGRLGAMVYGAPEMEHIQLNENTITNYKQSPVSLPN